MSLKSLVALALLLMISPEAWGEDKKEDDPLKGTWVPKTAELGGKPLPEDFRKATKLEIDGEKYTVTVGPMVDKGTAKRNAAASPKELDITGGEGPNKGKLILAIYEQTGDTLRVCYDLSGKARPTEFKTSEGTFLFLVTYERQKP